ncbi:MAG: hypothetical protein PWP38_2610 [Clostridiales bacterium]|nr:hypothetical protein [Clostridiales bacterium]
MHQIRNRIMIFFIIIVVMMAALVVRLYYIQIYSHEELTAMAKDQQNKNIPIPAKRGNILDRNGDKIAFSVKTYTVWARTSEITETYETARLIGEALSLDVNAINTKMTSATTDFVKVASDLSKSDGDMIKKKGIKGVSITEDTKRIYPYDNLASHIIGNVNANLDGFTGLEYIFNDTLKGKAGAYFVTTDVHGRQLAYGEDQVTQPEDGKTIELTIDDTIQYFVESRLDEAMAVHQADSASAIVMDPKTGEILAMASKPDFNLNDPRAVGADMAPEVWATMDNDAKAAYYSGIWKNITISNVYEPGSVFKAITASIALEENLVSLNEKFYCSGSKDVAGVTLKCWVYPYQHGEETFLEALENSCNPVFMTIIDRIGASLYYKYLDQFGLLAKTGISLPSEVNSITYKEEDVHPVELATMAYGHGNAYTMMQVIRALSAVVNGGNLMEPHIVKAILDEEGNVVEAVEPVVVNRVISEETSATMRMMLESVVANGTGSNAYIEGIRIGGKTGSSRKFEDGSYQENKVFASFMGVAPIDDPQFIVLVVVDEPKDQFGGGSVAAPIVKSIFEDILRYKNILPEATSDEKITVPNLYGMTYEEAVAKLDKMKVNHASDPLVVEDTSLVVTGQFPAADTVVSKNAVIILSVGE